MNEKAWAWTFGPDAAERLTDVDKAEVMEWWQSLRDEDRQDLQRVEDGHAYFTDRPFKPHENENGAKGRSSYREFSWSPDAITHYAEQDPMWPSEARDERELSTEEVLTEYIGQLPVKYRDVLYAYYFDQRTLTDIGAERGVAKNTSAAFKATAVKKLLRLIAEDDPDYELPPQPAKGGKRYDDEAAKAAAERVLKKRGVLQ